MRVAPGLLGLLLSFATAQAAFAQFSQLITDFEEPEFVTFNSEVMFRDPRVSGTTEGVQPAPAIADTYLTDVTIDTFSRANSPTRSSATIWSWVDAADPTALIRLITFESEELRNPALHLGGKVRMWVSARAFTDATLSTPVNNANLFFAIDVRETGAGAALGTDGGEAGDVEWVGLTARPTEITAGDNGVCDTTADPNSDDIQVIAPGQGGLPSFAICVTPGPDGVLQTEQAGDDGRFVTPRGSINVPSDGVMRLYEFDLPALDAADAVFSLSGDGDLLATPNNRGTLSGVVFTNDPNNSAVSAQTWLINIDDVEFEAPLPDPPFVQIDPEQPRPLDEEVTIDGIDPNATLVELVAVNAGGETVLASLDPMGATSVLVPTQPLASGLNLATRQTLNGVSSDNSSVVRVASAGNGPLRIAMAVRETGAFDTGLGCGADGTGFDPDQPSTLEFVGASGQEGFGVPNAPTFNPSPDWMEIQFDPCDETFGVAQFSGNGVLDLNEFGATDGVWEGLYFRIDEDSPTVGPFTAYIDDIVVKDRNGVEVCLVDDFESYTPGDVVVADFSGNGQADTLADPNSDDVQVVSPGTPTFGGQILVRPGPDGILQTELGGDDLFSTIHARFNFPGVAGTSVGLSNTPDLTAVTAEQSFSGSQSLLVQWGFSDTANLESVLRLTSNGSLATDAPESFIGPDPVIPISSVPGTLCDNPDGLIYSIRLLLLPPDVPGDCDQDGDVDLFDVACIQDCASNDPAANECVFVDIAPKDATDGVVNGDDYQLFQFLVVGP